MAVQYQTLRDRQISSIEKILNLNQHSAQDVHHEGTANGLLPANSPILSESGEPIWKVLVFDDMGRDVISSVLRVSDLRAWGITIHLNINTTRHAIPDVPVIYLVEPNAKNLQMITSDLSRSLYSPAYVNFLSSIPRPLLEDFAAQTAASGTSEHLAQIYDQYLNFVVSEPDLFSLSIPDAYSILNSAQTTDEELDITIDRIVSGLFSVVVTMGTIPIIRCPKGGAAEMICAKLDRRLRDHILNSKTNLFSGGDQKSAAAINSRPVLIVVDRTVDLIPLLSHSWTYQSLVYDVLKMHLNRITMEVPQDENNPGKGVIKKSYDLNSNDFFWAKNCLVPFPQVAEDIDAELTRYKEDANEVTRKTGASSLEDLQSEANASAAHLKAAITLLPELRERKSTLDMHMNILGQLLKGIKDRQLDNFFQIEENITKTTKAQMMELIKEADKGNEPLDKLRLFIIWYLSIEQEVSRTDLEGFDEALRAAGADTISLKYVKQVRQLTKMTMISSAPTQSAQSGPSNELFRGFSSLSSRVTDRFKDAGLGTSFENVLGGIKNFLPANKDTTLTKITESLMDPQNASSSAISKTENYLYFDPRSANARGTLPPASQARTQSGMPGGLGGVQRGIEASFGQRRQGFSEAIVFAVGGGSMDEYGNLQEWAKRTSGGSSGTGPRRRVLYGSTELLSATEFVTKELARLGKESS
ncbi:SEC1 family transport protein-like protein SLY1 [Lepidopterella palustris CBS 459.81]|uniref:SEC1 family transport protein-like protein SLY1 n=1 Tax=Lepidopterella palustris CBS 459.81 TaxID=1314670 RepID=A0A8E2E9P4_9PEZI|nr:SEC1 family transport protein-like protein SLY1 [Lepidopterella palustris CBS 459.81]